MTRTLLYHTIVNVKHHPDKNIPKKHNDSLLRFPDEELNDNINAEREAIREKEAIRLEEARKHEERRKEGRRIADEIKRLMRLSREKKNANTKRLRNRTKQRRVETLRKTIRNRIRRTLTVKQRPAFPRYR